VGDLIRALPPCPQCWFVVVMPSVGISTPEAFKKYDQVGSPVHPNCAAQEAAVRAGSLQGICEACGNALEFCSGAQETSHIREMMMQNGAVASMMTGSGAAVFGIFDTEKAAQAAREALHKEYRHVYLAQPDRGGARVVPQRVAAKKQEKRRTNKKEK